MIGHHTNAAATCCCIDCLETRLVAGLRDRRIPTRPTAPSVLRRCVSANDIHDGPVKQQIPVSKSSINLPLSERKRNIAPTECHPDMALEEKARPPLLRIDTRTAKKVDLMAGIDPETVPAPLRYVEKTPVVDNDQVSSACSTQKSKKLRPALKHKGSGYVNHHVGPSALKKPGSVSPKPKRKVRFALPEEHRSRSTSPPATPREIPRESGLSNVSLEHVENAQEIKHSSWATISDPQKAAPICTNKQELWGRQASKAVEVDSVPPMEKKNEVFDSIWLTAGKAISPPPKRQPFPEPVFLKPEIHRAYCNNVPDMIDWLDGILAPMPSHPTLPSRQDKGKGVDLEDGDFSFDEVFEHRCMVMPAEKRDWYEQRPPAVIVEDDDADSLPDDEDDMYEVIKILHARNAIEVIGAEKEDAGTDTKDDDKGLGRWLAGVVTWAKRVFVGNGTRMERVPLIRNI